METLKTPQLPLREAGVLLHITSLPGPYGIGDLGPEAHAFIEWAAGAGLTLWQILPLGPTGYGNCPYAAYSSFAGNALLISPDLLVEDGFLDADELAGAPAFPPGRVDYDQVVPWKTSLLRLCFERFEQAPRTDQRAAFDAFCTSKEQACWLDDYCLFRAIKDAHAGAPWYEWERPLAAHNKDALNEWEQKHQREVDFYRFCQFLFFSQWDRLHDAARERGIRIIGDVPIYCAHDSADVWANQHLFSLKPDGRAEAVAGVPPDYFSPTGQLWGNPTYRWDVHKRTNFAWWRDRIRATFRMVDILRIDHFRGIESYWEVPANEKTAIRGKWRKGPGRALFDALRDVIGDREIIAEDLGLITEDVAKLRDELGLPGMHVLQFGFAPHNKFPGIPNPYNPNAPHRHRYNAVVYTGTHDNDTTRGWYDKAPEVERHITRTYLSVDGGMIHWDMIKAAFASVARWAIVPVQDILGTGEEGRMNRPGVADGNWEWRLPPGSLTKEIQEAVAEIVRFYNRFDPGPEIIEEK